MSFADDKRSPGNTVLRYFDKKDGERYEPSFASLEIAEHHLLDNGHARSIVDLRRVSIAGFASWHMNKERERGLMEESINTILVSMRKLTNVHGGTPISEVESSDVLAILQAMVTQERAVTYIKDTARILVSMFDRAMARGCITANPAQDIIDGFNLGRDPRRKTATGIDDRQYERIRMASRPIELAAIDLLGELGATGREALLLEWGLHIDFARRTIFLPLPDLPATEHTPALTGRGRPLKMTDRLLASLLRHWLTRPKPEARKVFSVRFDGMGRDAFHDLLARPQLRCGLDVPRKKALGPKTTGISLVRYHISDFSDRGAIKQIKALLGPTKRTNLLDVADALGLTTAKGVKRRLAPYVSHGDEFGFLAAVEAGLYDVDA